MSPAYLEEHFGGCLRFRSCISAAGFLAYGTVNETEQICLETLMPYRGYHFAPTHYIQDTLPRKTSSECIRLRTSIVCTNWQPLYKKQMHNQKI